MVHVLRLSTEEIRLLSAIRACTHVQNARRHLFCGIFQADDGIRDIGVPGVQSCALCVQAEDGIRDIGVTGVQTCALPISAKGNALQNVLTLWSPRLARTTAVSWLMWFSVAFAYYSFFSWIPSLLLKEGLTMTKSFGYSIAIYGAQIPGYFSAAWLNERLGRKGVVASYMLLGGIAAITLAFSHTGLQIMAAGILLSFFMNGAFAGVYAYTPEVFPTAVRATGTGSSSSFGRIGSVSAPILVGLVYPVLGFPGVFAMTTTVLLVGACVVFFLGIETRNRSLEDIEEGGAGQPQDLHVPLSSTELRG